MRALLLIPFVAAAFACSLGHDQFPTLPSAFGKGRAEYEKVLGPTVGTRKDPLDSGTTYDYRWHDRDVALVIDDKTNYVLSLTLFEAGSTWQEAAETAGLDPEALKVKGVHLSGIVGADGANFYADRRALTIYMPKPKEPAVHVKASQLPPSVAKGLRSIIGLTSVPAIQKAIKRLAPGAKPTVPFSKFNWGYTVFDCSGDVQGGSSFDDLPARSVTLGRGDSGKGPVCLKLTFLFDGSPDGVLELASYIAGIPKGKLQFGPLSKRTDLARIRRITGSPYVIEAVGWNGDPKQATEQLVVGVRAEKYEYVTYS